jgi:DnaJ-domain-containing protein 1
MMTELARGSVADRPWGRTLAALGLRGVSGQLTLLSEGKHFLIAFEHGAIVAAASPLGSDAAVRVALTSHLISSSQVPEISRRQAASPERDEVEVIAELARLGPEHAQRLRRRVIAQRAARTFSINHGDFLVTDHTELEVLPGCELDIRAIIYMGARANLSEQRLAAELAQLGGWFRLKAAVDEDLPQFGFTDVEQPVVERLRDGGTLAELEDFATTFVDARTVRAVVYALAAYNACDVAPPVRRQVHPTVPPALAATQPLPKVASPVPPPRAFTQPIPRTVTPPGSEPLGRGGSPTGEPGRTRTVTPGARPRQPTGAQTEPMTTFPGDQGAVLRSPAQTEPMTTFPGDQGAVLRSPAQTEPMTTFPGDQGAVLRSPAQTEPMTTFPGDQGAVLLDPRRPREDSGRARRPSEVARDFGAALDPPTQRDASLAPPLDPRDRTRPRGGSDPALRSPDGSSPGLRYPPPERGSDAALRYPAAEPRGGSDPALRPGEPRGASDPALRPEARGGSDPALRPGEPRGGSDPALRYPAGPRDGSEPALRYPGGPRDGSDPALRYPGGPRDGSDPAFRSPAPRDGADPAFRSPAPRDGADPAFRYPAAEPRTIDAAPRRPATDHGAERAVRHAGDGADAERRYPDPPSRYPDPRAVEGGLPPPGVTTERDLAALGYAVDDRDAGPPAPRRPEAPPPQGAITERDLAALGYGGEDDPLSPRRSAERDDSQPGLRSSSSASTKVTAGAPSARPTAGAKPGAAPPGAKPGAAAPGAKPGAPASGAKPTTTASGAKPGAPASGAKPAGGAPAAVAPTAATAGGPSTTATAGAPTAGTGTVVLRRVAGSRPPPARQVARTDTPQSHSVKALIAQRLKLLDQGADHFQLLGVGHEAAPEALRKAYFALARQLHPDRLAALGISDDGRHAQRLFAEINAGFAILSDPDRRAEYLDIVRRGGEAAIRAEQARAEELARRIVEAEEAFHRGELALRRDQPAAAAAELERAVQLNPEEADYHALLAWAQFCAAPDKPAVAAATRGQLERAILRSPLAVTGRFYLGRVERMLGRDADAARHFRDVLEAAPHHAEAAAELRALDARLADKPGGGLFGRKR